MKKKIALLLAVIMTLSIMPVTIFAASTGSLEKGTLNLKKDTRYDGSDTAVAVPAGYKRGGQIANGLVLEMKENQITGSGATQKFRIQLTNAEFSNIAEYGGGKSIGVSTINVPTSGAFLDDGTIYNGLTTTRGALWADTITINGVAATPGSFAIELDSGLDDTATVTITPSVFIKGDRISIPLPLVTDDIADADVSVTVIANNSQVTGGNYLISRTASSATNTIVKEIETGREIISLANILIQEKLVGSLKNLTTVSAITNSGAAGMTAIELLAPSGYEFIADANGGVPTTVGLTGTGEFTGLTRGTMQFNSNVRDNSSILVGISGAAMAGTNSTILPETIVISGLQIQPIDAESTAFGEMLQIGIFKYAGNQLGSGYQPLDGLTEQYFDAAKRLDWAVSVTAATAKDVVTGRYDARIDANEQVAAKVTFKELELGAWISERTTDFVLPEGVSIRGVKFDTWNNIEQSNPASAARQASGVGSSIMQKDRWTFNAAKPAAPTSFSDGVVTIDKNVLSLKGLDVRSGKKAEIAFTLYLSISPEFAGDVVTLATEGTAVQADVPEVVIANAIKPVTVTAKITDVQIGFQKYAVSDITIKENKAGAILRNASAPNGSTSTEGLILTIQDYISPDIKLVPVTPSQVNVTEGDLKLTLKKTSAGQIAFDVDRTSTKASTIEIKGVEIKIDRTVPYGVYDLVVGGQSVFANKSNTGTNGEVNALFDEYGYSTPYINVATEGSNSPLKSNVKIAKDSDVAIVDGVQKQMMYPTYFDVSQSSFLVPARFISQIFGVEDNNIFWNNDTKTVSIITANRTLQFTAGSSTMLVAANGASSGVTMTAKAILHPVTERLYVPFRAIGDAFGVSVDYDEATGTAEYNKVK